MELYTLSDLNNYLKRVISLNFPDAFWVKCEISSITHVRGQSYLDLVQQDEITGQVIAQNQGVIWYKTSLFIRKKLGELYDSILSDGMDVLLKVKLDHHEKYGTKLTIEDIDPSYTLGQKEMSRQKIVDRLQKEDLIERNASLPLAQVIQSIAVISSETAAGLQDFESHLYGNRYGYDFLIDLYPSAMQGANVEKDVLNALNGIAMSNVDYDCVIITRGGGSKVDLSWFDNYKIGKTVAKFSIPVFTGIGHDIDETVTDLVAYEALKTPTALADFIVEHNAEFEIEIIDLMNSVYQLSSEKIREGKRDISEITEWINYGPREKVFRSSAEVDRIQQDIRYYYKSALERQKIYLLSSENLINLADPIHILSRGYSIIRDNEKIITSSKDLTENKEVTIEMKDGKKQATVNIN